MSSRIYLLSSALAIAVSFTPGCVLDSKVGSNSENSNGIGGTGGSAGSGGSSGSAGAAGATNTGGLSGSAGAGGAAGSAGSAGAGGGTSVPEVLHTNCRIQSLAQDADAVYFYDSSFAECDGGGRLVRLPKLGGSPQYFVPVGFSPTKLAVDGTHIYWSESTNGKILKVPKSGGSPETLVSGLKTPGHLQIHAGFVYYATHGSPVTPPAKPTDGTVEKVPTKGGTPTILVNGLTHSGKLAVDSSGVYYSAKPPATPPSVPLPLWSLRDTAVWRVGHSGGASQLIAVPEKDHALSFEIQIDGSDIYFYSVFAQQGLWKTPKTLSAPPQVNTPVGIGKSHVWSFAISATTIYMGASTDGFDNGDEMLWSQPKDGSSPPKALVPHIFGDIRTMVVDDKHLYWAEHDDSVGPSPAILYRMPAK